MNRAERRQLHQAQRGKSSPRRREKPSAVNTMDMARARASRLTDSEIAYILQPAIDGFDALRRGVGSRNDWRSLAQLVTFGVTIEASGIVKGLSEYFAAARGALLAVRERVTSTTPPGWGKSTAMRSQELLAVVEAIRLHRFQLEQVAASELQRMYQIVARAEAAGHNSPDVAHDDAKETAHG